MRKVCLVLDGGPETEGLLGLMVAWKAIDDHLEVGVVVCPCVASANPAMAEAIHHLAIHPNGVHRQPPLLELFEQLRVTQSRTCEQLPLEVISQESAFSDILVMGRELFAQVRTMTKGLLTEVIHCPIYLPGPEVGQIERAVLMCDMQPVKQTLQLLQPLLSGKELVILNTKPDSPPDEEKQLVRYVQSYFPRPAYYYTTALEDRDLRVVMRPNSLISIPLHSWEQNGHLLESLLSGGDWARNASIFFTVA